MAGTGVIIKAVVPGVRGKNHDGKVPCLGPWVNAWYRRLTLLLPSCGLTGNGSRGDAIINLAGLTPTNRMVFAYDFGLARREIVDLIHRAAWLFAPTSS